MFKHRPRPLTPNLSKQEEAHMEDTPRPSGRTSPADYLEEAVTHLRKVQESLEAAEKEAAHEEAAGRTACADGIRQGLAPRHMALAVAWTRLAAIERGLLPPEMARQDGEER